VAELFKEELWEQFSGKNLKNDDFPKKAPVYLTRSRRFSLGSPKELEIFL